MILLTCAGYKITILPYIVQLLLISFDFGWKCIIYACKGWKMFFSETWVGRCDSLSIISFCSKIQEFGEYWFDFWSKCGGPTDKVYDLSKL